jgi:transposase
MSAPIPLRHDFDAPQLRSLAKKTKDGPQARRLLALAAIYDDASRTEAAKIGGVGLQIIRDWVLHFNERGPHGLLNGKTPGQPTKLNYVHRQAIVRIIESGPIPAVHGVVRWRLIDLAQWIFEEFRITIAKQTLSRELRTMGYRKLSARPRHHAQAEGAIENFKKVSPRVWRQSREKKRSTAKRLKSGSPTKRALAKRTRSRDGGPSAAPVPARRVTSAPLPPTSSARSAQSRARAQP